MPAAKPSWRNMKPTLYLAPIQGITDRIYRNVYSKYFNGFDSAIAPFIAISHRNKDNRKLLKEFESQQNTVMITIPQILSKDPENFIPLAQSLYDMGYTVINWNLGCPYPMVVNKGKGAGLLCYPAKICDFLEKTIPSVKAKISIKLRLGLVYPEEIIELIPIFNKFPLAELIIHPRTGKQMYTGNVDLDTFEQCIALSQHEIVYNGDITTVADYVKLRTRFSTIDRWMIGRGALNNPFLAGEIKGINAYSYAEKIKIIYSFHNDLFEEYSKILSGPKHIMDKMKSEWTHLANMFPSGDMLQKIIKKIDNPKHYLDVIHTFFIDAMNS